MNACAFSRRHTAKAFLFFMVGVIGVGAAPALETNQTPSRGPRVGLGSRHKRGAILRYSLSCAWIVFRLNPNGKCQLTR